ncbi:sulfur carrier protein ThiS [Luteolibacter sp. SL250]|uniref:sulfur carrier protein ThiS n=1 Tax=Luteolibacter sp. SL250 TaxID=2995170 RepID=UPI00226F84C4|nr:sulfur carrier protein ThiS [Luteolibacter sp. SL250]WAC17941.1 sulfur carrier protein ThiS [Luteolibacter sp. SL250]
MTPATTITLNGNSHPLDRPMTLSELLENLGLGGKPVVIEVDEEAVFPRNYGNTSVKDGSRVEIVTLAAGG